MIQQRSFEWYSGGKVPPGRKNFTTDGDKLPQPLYQGDVKWFNLVMPLWVPQQMLITQVRVIFGIQGVSVDVWDQLNDDERLVELDIWTDPGRICYLTGQPPGSELGQDYGRISSVFFDFARDRWYAQDKTLPFPVMVDRAKNDSLNIEIANGQPLDWCVVQFGLRFDDSGIAWPNYRTK